MNESKPAIEVQLTLDGMTVRVTLRSTKDGPQVELEPLNCNAEGDMPGRYLLTPQSGDEGPVAVTAAEQLAAKVRAQYRGMGGRLGFLSDPGGWMDFIVNMRADEYPTDEDHALARAAIDIIEAEAKSAPVPETAEDMVAYLNLEHGVDDAFVMDPGPGTVHVHVPEGSVFLSDFDGGHPDRTLPRGHSIGLRFDDGTEERELWQEATARSITGALAKLAELAEEVTLAQTKRNA